MPVESVERAGHSGRSNNGKRIIDPFIWNFHFSHATALF